MSWYKLAKADIYPYYEDDDDDLEGLASWEIADKIDEAFRRSKVRPSSTKEYSHYALLGDDVAGGVVSDWTTDDDMMVATYSFDVAVMPEYRGQHRVGIDLIDEAIERYKSESSMYEEMGYDTQMRVEVINPRLAKFLEKHRDFEIDEDYTYPGGPTYMIYTGE